MVTDEHDKSEGRAHAMHAMIADPVRVALSTAIDTLFGKKSRIAILEFIDIKNDFFEIAQNGYNRRASVDKNNMGSEGQEDSSNHILSRQEVESTLKALFGTAGAAQVLALFDFELQKQKFER